MKALIIKMVICLFICSSDTLVSYAASPRMLMLSAMLMCLHYEWHIKRTRAGIAKLLEFTHMDRGSEGKMVKENFELSQTVMNMSDQHTLLCEIRTCVLRSIRHSQDVLAELGITEPRRAKTSPSSHPASDGPPSPFPERRTRYKESPDLLPRRSSAEYYSNAKKSFRESLSKSESNITDISE